MFQPQTLHCVKCGVPTVHRLYDYHGEPDVVRCQECANPQHEEPTYWDASDNAEELHSTSIADAIGEYIDSLTFGSFPRTIELVGWVAEKPKLNRDDLLEYAIGALQRDFGFDLRDPGSPTEAMIEAADVFARVVESGFDNPRCHRVVTIEVDTLAWLEAHAPEILEEARSEGLIFDEIFYERWTPDPERV